MSSSTAAEESGMELTIHGSERILSRTKMLAKDVLSILAAEAVVELGSDRAGLGYLLFFSPPDQCPKIAVVSHDRMRLVSVWHSSFKLPSGVENVTPDLARRARDAMKRYLFHKAVTPQSFAANRFRVALQLWVGAEVIRQEDAGEVCFQGRVGDLGALLPQLGIAARLKPIVSKFDAHESRSSKKKSYAICLLDPVTLQVRQRHLAKPETMHRYLEAA
ncbi:MAG TPA: hypothetical protein VFY28_02015 [Candidatus Paceibacterota bacterium]|nr:hypothetical protein [Candidatus Paceibacterota bacterium]